MYMNTVLGYRQLCFDREHFCNELLHNRKLIIGINTEEDVMAREKLKEIVINRDWCKGCGICVKFCPTKVLELDSKDKAVAVRPEDCICCRMCELRCPDLAMEVLTEEGEKNE